MADQMRDALGKMLDQYDERRRGDLARVQHAKDEDALFLKRFAELARDVVRPVFESAGALLAERGHQVRIFEEEFSADAGGKVTEAGISIQFLPAGMQSPAADDHARSLSITTRHYNRTVWINAGVAMNAGGIAGSKGAYPLEKVNRQLVEEELLKFIGTVVAA
jgi:hypothetical protein